MLLLSERLKTSDASFSRETFPESCAWDAAVPVPKRVEHQVHRVVERHHEARHARVGDRDVLPGKHLVDPQRNHAPAARHHVPVARAANRRRGVFPELARLGDGDFFHHRLGNAHRVDRVTRLVRRKNDHVLHAVRDRRIQHVFRPAHVRLNRLHREKFAGGHLLERRRVKDVVHAAHRAVHGSAVPHVADVKFHFRILKPVPHVVLLLFVPRKNADFSDVGVQKAPQHSVPERSRSSLNQQRFFLKNRHNFL